ncbi:uroporphyrinogen-III synthase, partial [bacterium]|nr:uroporphyrinogen-III synthase [bacterium]
VERGVRGKSVLLPRADIAREALARALEAAGAVVDEVSAYRTVEGDGDASVLLRAMDEGALDLVCFTSSSTVRHVARRIGDAELRRRFSKERPIVASMGPIASATLRELGVEPQVEASEHTASGLVAAVRAALSGT